MQKSSQFWLLLLFYFILLIIYTVTSFISWNYLGVVFVINLILLFRILDNISKISFKIFLIEILLFLVGWSVGSLFWMINVDNGIFAIFSITLEHYILFIIFYIIQKWLNFKVIFFIPFWLLFELFNNYFSFTFPWLTIGNVIANQGYLVNWYKITGVIGGSLWLLLISLSLYKVIVKKKKIKKLILFVICFITPFIVFQLSKIYYNEPISIIRGDKLNVATVNPEYFDKRTLKDRFVYNVTKGLSKKEKIDLLLIPETSVRGMFSNTFFTKTFVYKYFKKSIEDKDVRNIIFGSSGFFKKNYLANAAIFMDKDTSLTKVKKRLVPYSEYMFPTFYPFFDKKFYRSDIPDSEKSINNKLKIKLLICYESIYPYYVSEKFNKVNFIVLLSSEHFMNGSFYGQKQYNNLIRLRAIENNRELIKSSSFGSSIHYDSNGKIKYIGNKKFNYFSIFSKEKNDKTIFTLYGLYSNILIILILFSYSFIDRLISKN